MIHRAPSISVKVFQLYLHFCVKFESTVVTFDKIQQFWVYWHDVLSARSKARVEQSSVILGIGTTQYLILGLPCASPIIFTSTIDNLSNIILAVSLLAVGKNVYIFINQTLHSSNLSKCFLEIVLPMCLHASKCICGQILYITYPILTRELHHQQIQRNSLYTQN